LQKKFRSIHVMLTRVPTRRLSSEYTWRKGREEASAMTSRTRSRPPHTRRRSRTTTPTAWGPAADAPWLANVALHSTAASYESQSPPPRWSARAWELVDSRCLLGPTAPPPLETCRVAIAAHSPQSPPRLGREWGKGNWIGRGGYGWVPPGVWWPGGSSLGVGWARVQAGWVEGWV